MRRDIATNIGNIFCAKLLEKGVTEFKRFTAITVRHVLRDGPIISKMIKVSKIPTTSSQRIR